jgi:PKD domain
VASSTNSAPTANAGLAQSVVVGAVVTLDGTGSTDANNDPITYKWTWGTKPTGSAAALSSATTAKPTFTADLAGTYVLTLIVNDGKQDSSIAATTITASAANAAPVANAGVNQNVTAAAVVTLDGTASSDANRDALTYRWALAAKPTGSAATLSSATSAKPTFTADLAGVYVASLIVNDGLLDSVVSTTTITAAVANSAPVANAGTNQNVPTTSVVTLSGTGSTDANGDTLTYAWSFASKPTGSTAALSSATASAPTFTADLAGTYVINLIVNDGKVNSSNVSAVTVTASAANSTPVANAGTNQTVTRTGTPAVITVTLNGTGSTDANGDTLTYLWAITTKPTSSTAALSSTTVASPTFVADLAGIYVATLVVNDGKVSSTPATVVITAN